MARTTRRHLLAGVGALPLAGLAAAVPVLAAAAAHPDATLIAVCDRVVGNMRQAEEHYAQHPDIDDEVSWRLIDPIMTEVDDLIRRLPDLSASTAEGVAAKARALGADNPNGEYSWDDSPPLAAALSSMLRDAAALPHAGSAGVIPPSPDAVLIAEGERFLDLEAQRQAEYGKIPDPREAGREVARAAERAADAIMLPMEAEQRAIVGRMHGLRAATLAGHRMRARVLLAYEPLIKDGGDPEGYQNEQLTWLLVRDLVGGESV